MNILINRFKEPSTWRGVFMFASAVGISINPELQEHIIAGGMALVGIIGMFTGDVKE